MKKNNLKKICIFGVLASIILLFVTCRIQIKNGYARDAGIYVHSIIDKGLWIFMGVSILLCIAFLLLYRRAETLKLKRFAAMLVILLVVVGLTVNIGWRISFYKVKDSDIEHARLQNVTLDELETAIHESDFQVIYIGRDNCPLCEYIMPKFTSYLDEAELDVLYYNTKQDREMNKDNMDRVLEMIPVTSVPFVLVVKNQKIAATFTGEYVTEELRDYMEEIS